VGGVKLVEFWFPTLRPLLAAVGVSENELADVGGESFFTALESGRKIPAPGWVVAK
jgi:hypothetical protein